MICYGNIFIKIMNENVFVFICKFLFMENKTFIYKLIRSTLNFLIKFYRQQLQFLNHIDAILELKTGALHGGILDVMTMKTMVMNQRNHQI